MSKISFMHPSRDYPEQDAAFAKLSGIALDEMIRTNTLFPLKFERSTDDDDAQTYLIMAKLASVIVDSPAAERPYLVWAMTRLYRTEIRPGSAFDPARSADAKQDGCT